MTTKNDPSDEIVVDVVLMAACVVALIAIATVSWHFKCFPNPRDTGNENGAQYADAGIDDDYGVASSSYGGQTSERAKLVDAT